MSQFETNKKKVFAKQLKDLIKGWEKANNKKLTQEKLGQEVFVTRETVSGWLNSKSIPPEETKRRLCAFFNAPEWYFTKSNYDKGWTEIDEREHDNLEEECEKTAHKIGLSLSFVGFLKENPEISDAIISASWVDAYSQSFSPAVPLLPDNLFQFISSANIKVYPSEEVLYMLRVVQRDLTEYALFLLQKWSKVIKDAHEDSQKAGTKILGQFGWRNESGEEYTSATDRLAIELIGRGSLSYGASLLVSLYNNMTPTEQEELISRTYNTYMKKAKKANKQPALTKKEEAQSD